MSRTRRLCLLPACVLLLPDLPRGSGLPAPCMHRCFLRPFSLLSLFSPFSIVFSAIYPTMRAWHGAVVAPNFAAAAPQTCSGLRVWSTTGSFAIPSTQQQTPSSAVNDLRRRSFQPIDMLGQSDREAPCSLFTTNRAGSQSCLRSVVEPPTPGPVWLSGPCDPKDERQERRERTGVRCPFPLTSGSSASTDA